MLVGCVTAYVFVCMCVCVSVSLLPMSLCVAVLLFYVVRIRNINARARVRQIRQHYRYIFVLFSRILLKIRVLYTSELLYLLSLVLWLLLGSTPPIFSWCLSALFLSRCVILSLFEFFFVERQRRTI